MEAPRRFVLRCGAINENVRRQLKTSHHGLLFKSLGRPPLTTDRIKNGYSLSTTYLEGTVRVLNLELVRKAAAAIGVPANWRYQFANLADFRWIAEEHIAIFGFILQINGLLHESGGGFLSFLCAFV